MDSNIKDLYGNDPFIAYLEANARQRAALMALLTHFLKEENEELTVRNVKIAICNFFSRQIDEQVVVGDAIERDLVDHIMTFIKQEEIIEQFKF